MSQTKRPARSARVRLLDTASQLFYERGFQAVGVDEIVARSGVAKTTLYRHFPSKDDLVVAYLERSEEAFRDWFEQALASGATPVGQLLAVFAAVGELSQSTDCLGCTFQVTAAEFPDPRHPAHRIAVRHKRRVRATFSELAAAAGLQQPNALADQLLMLMDGAWVAARMFRRESPAAHALDAARAVLAAHR